MPNDKGAGDLAAIRATALAMQQRCQGLGPREYVGVTVIREWAGVIIDALDSIASRKGSST